MHISDGSTMPLLSVGTHIHTHTGRETREKHREERERHRERRERQWLWPVKAKVRDPPSRVSS